LGLGKESCFLADFFPQWGVFFSFGSKEKKQKKTGCRVAWSLECVWFVQKGREDGCCVFWCAGIWQIVDAGSSFLFEKEKNQKKITRPGVGARRAPAGAKDFRSFLFRQKGTEKPERHARSGKSPHSPHFRCGRARSRDVGCDWNWPRPACAFPAPKTGFGICLHSATSPVCACRILAAGKG